MAEVKEKDLRIKAGEELPEEYSEGSSADEFVCVAPKGCYHFFRFWPFGEVMNREDVSTAKSPVPRHFVPRTKDVMLMVKKRKARTEQPRFTMRGEEV